MPSADNYDSTATDHDGSCRYVVFGCTDSTKLGYNLLATRNDGSCRDRFFGCAANASAVNFDSLATVDDGSCRFFLSGCTDSAASNYQPAATRDDGSCVPLRHACTLFTALNYDSVANIDDGSCVPSVPGCMVSLSPNFASNATYSDGSCLIVGCTHPSAINYDSMANSDSGCRFLIPGCTDPRAFNYFVLADVDDGSCLYPGCTLPAAPNFDPSANVDDGSCLPRIVGCANQTAVNFLPYANVHVESLCVYAGCTDSLASNFLPHANLDDGSCIQYIRGCSDSRAVNYLPLAERDDGRCAFAGCIHSMAINFEPSATLDDESCRFQRSSGTVAMFGYLEGCEVFVDTDDDALIGANEPRAVSDAVGFYSIIYRDVGPVRLLPANPTSGRPCVDTISGAALSAGLRSIVSAAITSPLTTVAVHRTLQGDSTDAASATVCANVLPCVPCGGFSLQQCNAASSCIDACTLRGRPVSVFQFDALSEFLLAPVPDPAWASWLVAQINTGFSVTCARSALMCASPELCGNCEVSCGTVGVGNHSAVAVEAAIYAQLGEMAGEGPVRLEESSGTTLEALIERTAARLGGVGSRNAAQISQSCAASNSYTYSVLTSIGAGRRRLKHSAELPSPSDGGAATSSQVANEDSSSALASGAYSVAHLDYVVRLCELLQPGRPYCSRLRFGCMQPRALNYDTTASLDDGSCQLEGCTDTTALNFDPSANVEGASACLYKRQGCADPAADNYDPDASSSASGSCHYTIRGCTDSLALNFRPHADVDDGSCVRRRAGCMDPAARNYLPGATAPARCAYDVRGCTDSTAANYARAATIDDGGCRAKRVGCTTRRRGALRATNYDPLATVDSADCVFEGCTDSEARNYAPEATRDNGSCVSHMRGCQDAAASNYDSSATAGAAVCVYPVRGCTDSTATNFDAAAQVDDGRCAKLGCTAAKAVNFDPLATQQDRSCVWPLQGCTLSSATNYRSEANIDDGTCVFRGCTSSASVEYDPTATVDDGSCSAGVLGCTESAADNFRALARIDDGKCIFVGCTDSTAINFSPRATVSARCAYVSESDAAAFSSSSPNSSGHLPSASRWAPPQQPSPQTISVARQPDEGDAGQRDERQLLLLIAVLIALAAAGRVCIGRLQRKSPGSPSVLTSSGLTTPTGVNDQDVSFVPPSASSLAEWERELCRPASLEGLEERSWERRNDRRLSAVSSGSPSSRYNDTPTPKVLARWERERNVAHDPTTSDKVVGTSATPHRGTSLLSREVTPGCGGGDKASTDGVSVPTVADQVAVGESSLQFELSEGLAAGLDSRLIAEGPRARRLEVKSLDPDLKVPESSEPPTGPETCLALDSTRAALPLSPLYSQSVGRPPRTPFSRIASSGWVTPPPLPPETSRESTPSQAEPDEMQTSRGETHESPSSLQNVLAWPACATDDLNSSGAPSHRIMRPLPRSLPRSTVTSDSEQREVFLQLSLPDARRSSTQGPTATGWPPKARQPSFSQRRREMRQTTPPRSTAEEGLRKRRGTRAESPDSPSTTRRVDDELDSYLVTGKQSIRALPRSLPRPVAATVPGEHDEMCMQLNPVTSAASTFTRSQASSQDSARPKRAKQASFTQRRRQCFEAKSAVLGAPSTVGAAAELACAPEVPPETARAPSPELCSAEISPSCESSDASKRTIPRSLPPPAAATVRGQHDEIITQLNPEPSRSGETARPPARARQPSFSQRRRENFGKAAMLNAPPPALVLVGTARDDEQQGGEQKAQSLDVQAL